MKIYIVVESTSDDILGVFVRETTAWESLRLTYENCPDTTLDHIGLAVFEQTGRQLARIEVHEILTQVECL